jgi:ribonuclease HI
VGNGKKVKIWEDRWIPRSGAQYPLGCQRLDRPTTVDELLDTDGAAWDEQKVRGLFFEPDVSDILSIPVGGGGADDVLAWNHTKNGIFTVKSAYHLALQCKEDKQGGVGGSSTCDHHKSWLAVWGAQVPNKMKVHLWRLIENGLAVGAELRHRKIKDGVTCLVCDKEESLAHRFWLCPHSASAWNYLQEVSAVRVDVPPRNLTHHSDLKGWLLDWIGKGTDDQVALLSRMVYNLWMARNDARETKRMGDPRSIVRRSMEEMQEWLDVHHKPMVSSASRGEHWLPPEEDWVKANADGAFRSADNNGGGGVVLRDHHGSCLGMVGRFYPRVGDAEHAELLACHQALIFAKEKGVDKVVLETDSTGVAAKLKTEDLDRSAYGMLAEDIKKLSKGFEDFSVRTVRRSANGVAHLVAKVSCDNKSCNRWMGAFPDCIQKALDLDRP